MVNGKSFIILKIYNRKNEQIIFYIVECHILYFDRHDQFYIIFFFNFYDNHHEQFDFIIFSPS